MIAMYLYVYFHFAFEVRETTNLFWILFHELLQLSLLQMLNIAFFMHIPLLGPESGAKRGVQESFLESGHLLGRTAKLYKVGISNV